MSTHTSESAVLHFPIDKIWGLLRPMDFVYDKRVMSTKTVDMGNANEAMGVGDERLIIYLDGTKQQIRLTALSDHEHTLSWTVVTSTPAVSYSGVQHTVRLHRVTTSGGGAHAQTYIEWSSDYAKDAGADVLADSKYKKLDAFNAIRHEAERKFRFFTTAEEAAAGHDMKGKTVLVTGGNSGLGLETVRVLATTGAHVVFTTRDEKKAAATEADLKKAQPNAKVEGMVCSLDSIASIKAFATAFTAKHKALHVCILNAGVMACPQSKTVDGFEMQFGTNHIGHFLLTQLLLPTIKASAPARIVVLSSGLHRRCDFHFDDPNFTKAGSYGRWTAYGSSKTANILFAKELNRSLKKAGVKVTVNAVHPGVIQTGLGRHLNPDVLAKEPIWGFNPPAAPAADAKKDAKDNKAAPAAATAAASAAAAAPTPRAHAPRYKSVGQGAATTVVAALCAPFGESGGHYMEDCNIATPNHYAANMAAAAKLWELTEKLIAGVGK